MSETNKSSTAEPIGVPHEEEAHVQRKGKRRNGFVVPGSSDPKVAQQYWEKIQKQSFGQNNES